MGVPAVLGIGKTGNLPMAILRIVSSNIGRVPNGMILCAQTNDFATTAVLKVMKRNKYLDYNLN